MYIDEKMNVFEKSLNVDKNEIIGNFPLCKFEYIYFCSNVTRHMNRIFSSIISDPQKECFATNKLRVDAVVYC